MTTNPYPTPLVILIVLLLLAWLMSIMVAKKFPNKFDFKKLQRRLTAGVIILGICTMLVIFYALSNSIGIIFTRG